LDGVTQGILFEIEPETGIPVVQQAARPEDLYSADEGFISSTNATCSASAGSTATRSPQRLYPSRAGVTSGSIPMSRITEPAEPPPGNSHRSVESLNTKKSRELPAYD